MAVAFVLSFASDIGFPRAVLEGDSWTVYRALMGDDFSLALFALLIEDAKFEAQKFEQLPYSHTKRDDNFVTHSLTRYAIGILDFFVWVEDVLPQFHVVFQVDLERLRS